MSITGPVRELLAGATLVTQLQFIQGVIAVTLVTALSARRKGVRFIPI